MGELALGTGMPPSFARELALLPCVPTPAAHATRSFVERRARAFAGAGAGWTDAQIIYAAEEAGALLYSADAACGRCGVGWATGRRDRSRAADVEPEHAPRFAARV